MDLGRSRKNLGKSELASERKYVVSPPLGKNLQGRTEKRYTKATRSSKLNSAVLVCVNLRASLILLELRHL